MFDLDPKTSILLFINIHICNTTHFINFRKKTIDTFNERIKIFYMHVFSGITSGYTCILSVPKNTFDKTPLIPRSHTIDCLLLS